MAPAWRVPFDASGRIFGAFVRIWQVRHASLARCYRSFMIDLGTIAGLRENRHERHAFCARLLPVENAAAETAATDSA
jgi:hypothetical protein